MHRLHSRPRKGRRLVVRRAARAPAHRRRLGLTPGDVGGAVPGVDGTFIWIPSHDQRPRSLSTVLRRSWLRSLVGREPKSTRWSARSEVRTNDLDGRRSVEVPGDGHHGHGMWLIADLRTRLIRPCV